MEPAVPGSWHRT